MGSTSLIRRVRSVVRRHAADGACAALFLAALVTGSTSALSGIERFAGTLRPAAEPANGEGSTSARLLLFGFAAEPARYTPQVLFPAESHTLPVWLRARIASGPEPAAPQAPPAAGAPVIAICIDDLGEDIAGTDNCTRSMRGEIPPEQSRP